MGEGMKHKPVNSRRSLPLRIFPRRPRLFKKPRVSEFVMFLKAVVDTPDEPSTLGT